MKWEQVTRVLRERCRKLEPGESLGTLTALVQDLGVGMHLVLAARDILEREGWVELKGRRGLIRTHRNPDGPAGQAATAPPSPDAAAGGPGGGPSMWRRAADAVERKLDLVGPGGVIGSTKRIAGEIGFSALVVRDAMHHLRGQGKVFARRGGGWFKADARPDAGGLGTVEVRRGRPAKWWLAVGAIESELAQMKPGELLGSTANVAGRIGFSVRVVKDAMRYLKSQGKVVGLVGRTRGWYAADVRPDPASTDPSRGAPS